MPVAKLLGTGNPDAMKADEGTDSLDTFFRQAVGKEPLYSFSRTGDSPGQWIQLLHALDQQDHPGWPLLAPMKVQMQKCDKCAREFCSPINYRRHTRVHRRSLKSHKEPQKHRDLLGAFWDKLSEDEAKEIMSFEDVNLEEVPGASIIRNISANLCKPIYLSLPQVYVKAGSALVDIIQGSPSRIPISSPELFSILDDASERTFLCAGTAESLRKYVFDGEAGKTALEMKNLIACTSFLVEQKLVKAWLADKDAEALRCQKLLVEEEEAAQKRQAEVLERKRQRKLRQKERVREQLNEAKVDVYVTPDLFETTPSAEASSPHSSTEADSFIPNETFLIPLKPIQLSNRKDDIDIEPQGGCTSDHSDRSTGQDREPQKAPSNGFPHIVARWQVPKSQKGGRNNTLKWEQAHKHRDQRAGLVNGTKVWTKKPKSEYYSIELGKSRVENDTISQSNQSNCQLMIGSISVTLRNCRAAEIQENGRGLSTVKLWRPEIDTRGQLECFPICEKEVDQTLPRESSEINNDETEGMNDSCPQVEDGAKHGGIPFSIDAAKAFLAQRWKEAALGEHVKLVLSSPEPPGQPNDHQRSEPSEPPDRTVLGSTENRLGNGPNVKPKFRTKPEKSMKAKYIPKQRR